MKDLIQERFLARMTGCERFRRHSSFRTYLLAIVRDTLHSYGRCMRVRAGAVDVQVDIQDVSVASPTIVGGSLLGPVATAQGSVRERQRDQAPQATHKARGIVP